MSATTAPKTIAFLGATGGCGLSALKHSLRVGHTCIALCRTPSKLTDLLSATVPPVPTGSLIVKQGDAHSAAAVASVLAHPANAARLVDTVVVTIGGTLDLKKFTIPDPDVCRRAVETLWAALKTAREEQGRAGKPRIALISTTGITELGRDVPLAFMPMYHIMLKQPHADKKRMEESVVASGERWTLVRPSFLVDEPVEETKKDRKEKKTKTIREGVEDPVAGKVLSKAVGYTISKEDVGRWMFERLVMEEKGSEEWVQKVATITY